MTRAPHPLRASNWRFASKPRTPRKRANTTPRRWSSARSEALRPRGTLTEDVLLDIGRKSRAGPCFALKRSAERGRRSGSNGLERIENCEYPAPALHCAASFRLLGGGAAKVLGAGCKSPPAVIALRRISPRAPAVQSGRVSIFGATPKPTVTVRMEENGMELFLQCSSDIAVTRFPSRPDSGL